MRPLGVSIIAALTWLAAAFWALVGLTVIGFTHLGARLLSTLSDDNLLQRLTAGLGTTLGVVLLLVALLCLVLGFGLWKLKNWARVLTMILVGIGLLLGLRSVIEYHHLFRTFRTAVDAVILLYLFIPNVRKLFT